MDPTDWRPAGSAFEVVIGAYLTQNTAWTNVELAMRNLRGAGVLSIPGIRGATAEELERLVRPAGYYRQKAARLKRFVAHLDARHAGSLETMFAQPVETLRQELLGLNGIGPETADSIRSTRPATRFSWWMPTPGASLSGTNWRRPAPGTRRSEPRWRQPGGGGFA